MPTHPVSHLYTRDLPDRVRVREVTVPAAVIDELSARCSMTQSLP